MNSKPVDPAQGVHRIRFTASARAAWRLVLDELDLPAGSSILLPAYLGVTDREGSGVFDPVVESATPHSFYPVDERFQPDIGALESLLATGRHPLLLVIHYFGMRISGFERVARMCRRHNAILVEDCAHVPTLWAAGSGIGSTGDVAFYSLHKALPLETGGALKVNTAFVHLADGGRDDAGLAPALIARLDFEEISSRRRANYAWLSGRLRNTRGIRIPFPEAGDSVPLNFPLLVDDGLREPLYFALADAGFAPIALYYRLVDVITDASFPVSHALSRAVLNLPVHHELAPADLEPMARLLESRLADLRRGVRA